MNLALWRLSIILALLMQLAFITTAWKARSCVRLVGVQSLTEHWNRNPTKALSFGLIEVAIYHFGKNR